MKNIKGIVLTALVLVSVAGSAIAQTNPVKESVNPEICRLTTQGWRCW
jgi:hypothetical protein